MPNKLKHTSLIEDLKTLSTLPGSPAPSSAKIWELAKENFESDIRCSRTNQRFYVRGPDRISYSKIKIKPVLGEWGRETSKMAWALERWFWLFLKDRNGDTNGEDTKLWDLTCSSGLTGVIGFLQGFSAVTVYTRSENPTPILQNLILHSCPGDVSHDLSIDEKQDCIVLNFFRIPQLNILRRLRDSLRPGGILILTGFVTSQAPRLYSELERLGMTRKQRGYCDECLVATFQKII